jgi:hypothetical protein
MVSPGRLALFPGLSDLGYAPAIKERRAHCRRPVDENAELIIPSEYITLPCRVVNLSDGGACVVCDVVPRAATRIKLVIKDGRIFEGVTAWFENGQLGLSFAAG